MDRARQRIEVLRSLGALALGLITLLGSAALYIEREYERKIEAIEARVQIQIEIIELLERHHVLSPGDLDQLEDLREKRAQLMGNE